MTSALSLTSLAERLRESVVKIDESLPTVDELQSEETKAARKDVLELLHEIQVRVQGPVDLLEDHQIRYNSFSCLKWLLHFDIFTQVPLDYSSIAYTSLATLASVPLKHLESIARMAMLSGLFTEPAPTRIAHSILSMSFAIDSRLRDWGAFIAKYGAPSAHAMTEATQKWGATKSENETAYNAFSGAPVSFFEHVKTVPGMADLFARYMESQGLSEGARLEHVLQGFNWAGLEDRTHVVDVGPSMNANIHLITDCSCQRLGAPKDSFRLHLQMPTPHFFSQSKILLQD
jgi:6-hydroxytryprostatin B O-methyltransferase